MSWSGKMIHIETYCGKYDDEIINLILSIQNG